MPCTCIPLGSTLYNFDNKYPFIVIAIVITGYEHQLPAMRQIALFNWMANISQKRFGPHVENSKHDDVIKWKQFPSYWPPVRGIY